MTWQNTRLVHSFFDTQFSIITAGMTVQLPVFVMPRVHLVEVTYNSILIKVLSVVGVFPKAGAWLIGQVVAISGPLRKSHTSAHFRLKLHFISSQKLPPPAKVSTMRAPSTEPHAMDAGKQLHRGIMVLGQLKQPRSCRSARKQRAIQSCALRSFSVKL